MNNKGFTLVELLAVIGLLAIIMLIAVPNVISMIERGKKQTFLDDAKRFISLVEYDYVKNGMSDHEVFNLSDYSEKFASDPSNGEYDMDESYVIVIAGASNTYSIKLCGSKMKIVNVLSTNLSIDSVVDGTC